MTEEVIAKVFNPLELAEYSKFYAVGKTKILQMPEVKAVLDKAKVKASMNYDKQSRLIKRTYKFVE